MGVYVCMCACMHVCMYVCIHFVYILPCSSILKMWHRCVASRFVTHTYMHTHIHIYIHVYTHAQDLGGAELLYKAVLRIHTHTQINAYIHTYTCAHRHKGVT